MSATALHLRTPSSAECEVLSHVDLMRSCAIDGDEPAWEEFVSRYNRFICLAVLRAYCQRGGRRIQSVDVDVLKDLVQDVYLKVFETTRGALQGFRGANDAAVFVYLGRVALSVVVDHLRRNGARKRGADVSSLDAAVVDEDGRETTLADRIASPDPSPAEVATATILREEVSEILVRTARGRNAQRDLDIAEAFIFDGCSVTDIADRVGGGICESGVKSSIRRTSARLRSEIARLERASASNRALRPAAI
jgi:RNA polymerase sigma factor (sigma-70 family)